MSTDTARSRRWAQIRADKPSGSKTAVNTINKAFTSVSRGCGERCSELCESVGYGHDQVDVVSSSGTHQKGFFLVTIQINAS
ncbi:hypothetical protein ANCCEY_06463 [Ancylostoma ceylanicum]|uniref:Uncharacterized protein n=1 Tax=Ancylostoma ceylanicum TaxID=53326 RepID=A0A0D6LTD7_9BILA|nr:hypothetical protein ANCCEY_06463 [Ancylostoma ceylanicum]